MDTSITELKPEEPENLKEYKVDNEMIISHEILSHEQNMIMYNKRINYKVKDLFEEYKKNYDEIKKIVSDYKNKFWLDENVKKRLDYILETRIPNISPRYKVYLKNEAKDLIREGHLRYLDKKKLKAREGHLR